ncbi:zinc ABC transporter substrate-binding protein [Synechococcus sp. J7-Johnson]|uniref:metal ABC transporter solute-binding protein, Zn/Mn family n=1 Tax=Synechococcus sp. J7-Johnson TaxID=2823737 RepID=UPI0020CDA029|nr:zinc ABC transporter substrate-binding protein [Synechococcus sp. J7-Johnson]MCP9841941.1 zinc ABC transporter substrate-binding protein [Synechococcus sp. J7-Johnson]
MSLLLSCLRRTGLLGLSLVLVACGAAQLQTNDSSTSPASSSSPGSSGKSIKVVTTFLPITLFSRAVAGDCAEVKALIPASSGPHDFQARPGDLAALREAKVLVKNGLEMEGFLDKLVASAENPALKVIDSSRGVATIDSPEEPGHTDAKAEVDAEHSHETGHGHGHGHTHGAVNPHIWLDPLRAVQQVETIRDGLVKADPSCAEGYRRNAEAYTTQLRALNTEIAGQLKPFQGKTFVAFHDFAPYFAERFGLKAEFVVDVPEINPTPADLQRVSEIVERSQLQALLSEPQEGNRSFNALAKDLGVRVSVFDPMETASEQASRDPGTYFSVMRRNVADLRQAFGG